MFLMLYDIETKKDPHGIRVRLVRSLRKGGAFQLQKSAWILEEFNDDIIKVTDEFRRAGGSVKIAEWLPRSVGEVSGKGTNQSKVIALAIMGSEPIIEGWHDMVKSILERLGYKVLMKGVSESAVAELTKSIRTRHDLYLVGEKTNSRILDEVSLLDVDGVVLLNCGRSAQSGMIFGSQTIANTKILKNMTSMPLIQVERPGNADGVLLAWNESGKELGGRMVAEMGVPLITPSLEAKMITKAGGREVRQIHFASMGDAVVVNGHRVGVCLADQVYLIGENGRLVDIMGGKIFKREDRKSVV
jgi:hypothetical protein